MAKTKFEVIMQPWVIWPILVGLALYAGLANIEDIERLLVALSQAVKGLR